VWYKMSIASLTVESLLLEGLIILVGFSFVGTATGMISKQDWKYLVHYISLKLSRRPDGTT